MKKLNVFVDFHHAGLLQSLILLFEKRLGGEVYRPIGMDWATAGYWKVYDHPATQEQFLGIGGNTPDGSAKLNEVIENVRYGTYLCHDIDSDQTNKAITLDRFLHTKIDIVIASMPDHIEPFHKLCQLHPDHPKLIYQIGNSWNYDGSAPVKNIMASAIMGGMTFGLNTISYHQEFDTSIFHPPVYSDPMVGTDLCWNSYEFDLIPKQNIYSFVNCFDGSDLFKEDCELFKQVEQSMPDWSFKIHGGQCRDGAIGPAKVLADKMREARFIWHTKQGGDGYGHVIHNAPAVGRPLIVKKQYYAGKLAEALLIDGETCIAIDGMSYQEVINKINHYSQPGVYQKMAKASYDNFCRVVDFDKEQVELEKFMENLI
jgi:hypothetical protein